MRAMHNPELSSVDKTAVDKASFNPQVAPMNGTGAAPDGHTVVKLCTPRKP